MSTRFEKTFKKLLTEEPIVQNQSPDANVWKKSFDEPKNIEQFETDPSIAGFQTRYVEKAKTWIAKLEEVAEWLNGTEADSLNKQFNDLDKEGSIFNGVSSHSKKLTNIAGDLVGLAETIKGYILTADKKEKEIIDQSAQSTQQG